MLNVSCQPYLKALKNKVGLLAVTYRIHTLHSGKHIMVCQGKVAATDPVPAAFLSLGHSEVRTVCTPGKHSLCRKQKGCSLETQEKCAHIEKIPALVRDWSSFMHMRNPPLD